MSNVLSDLKPNKVFCFFEEISKIPRGSGNTKAISDYCVNFAKERKLRYYQDELNNIIIFKEASPGREKDNGVIIQGHLDMVTEKKPCIDHDFLNEGINLVIDGDFIHGKDTSLGADDGIGIAYALTILDSHDISHPAIEAVFTVDEEIGMLGAAYIDFSMIKGKYLLNIDSDEEGILTGGCAGGQTSVCKIPISYINGEGQSIKIQISGLKGGHSGVEINKERGNANILLGRVLNNLSENISFYIENIEGGQKDNAIPREASAIIITDPDNISKIDSVIKNMGVAIKNEYSVSDKEISISYEEVSKCESRFISEDDSGKIIFFLMNCPNGVIFHDQNIPELIETSLNLGILRLEGDNVVFTFSVRSSVWERKIYLTDKLKSFMRFLKGTYEEKGVYPEWKFRPNSYLLNKMSNIYEDMFEKKPEIKTIHAGLECGYFLEKNQDLQIVSFGPNNFDIHTTEERLSISSVQRMYDYIIQVLKSLK